MVISDLVNCVTISPEAVDKFNADFDRLRADIQEAIRWIDANIGEISGNSEPMAEGNDSPTPSDASSILGE